MNIHMKIYIYVNMYEYVENGPAFYMFIYVCKCIDIYIYVSMHIYIYVYIKNGPIFEFEG